MAKREFTSTQLALSTLIVLLGLFIWPQGWCLLAFSLMSLLLIKRFFIKRLGGFSGDIYGFLIEVTELVLLNVLLFGATS